MSTGANEGDTRNQHPAVQITQIIASTVLQLATLAGTIWISILTYQNTGRIEQIETRQTESIDR